MTKLLLVDDEPLARERLRRMLQGDRDYQILGEAANGKEAVALATKLRPDILLLDIRMPGMDGLEAAAHLAKLEPRPAIVFCTAYDEYAIAAFEVQALDYLLKPVRKEKLMQALQRARAFSQVQLQGLDQASKAPTHLSVKTHVGIELIPIDEVSHLLADQKYVTAFHFGREIVVDESLKTIEQAFADRFLRIHRNCLVGLQHVEKLARTPAGQSQINVRHCSEPLAVSRRHLAQVKKALKSL